MEGCLLIGGKGPERSFLGPRIAACSLIIAADSGLKHARELGIEPSEIVGDFDSVDQEDLALFPNIRTHCFQRDKDDTDTEIGIKLLRERGAETVHIVGGGGGRLDHLYAVLSLFHRENAPDHWYTHREHIMLLQGRCSIELPKGKRVSFFPVGTQICRMKSKGLKWPLDQLEWRIGDFGISNVATRTTIEIEVEEGRLIMMYDLGHEDRA